MASKLLDKTIKDILNGNSEYFRKLLDSNIHVVDLSYGTLKKNNPDTRSDSDFRKDYIYLIRKIEETFRNSRNIKEAVQEVTDKTFVGVVRYIPTQKLLVASNYKNMRDKLRPILKSLNEGNIFGQQHSSGVSTTNLGHLVSPLANNESPVSSKILRVLNLPIVNNNPRVVTELRRLYNELEEIHIDSAVYTSRTNLSKNNQLGSQTVLLTLHTFSKNNSLSSLEDSIMRKIEKVLRSSSYIAEFMDQKGSNSINEDIEELIVQTIKNGKAKLKPHVKKPAEVSKNIVKSKNTVNISSSTIKLRNQQGQFTSLINIQNLLNARINEQVAKNMGSGLRTDILNYRTGRFANSVKIDRVQMQRDSVLGIFYSYMKYPYQTFEPGYKQGSPRSRDPRILISGSIRELATKLISSRLRTIRL